MDQFVTPNMQSAMLTAILQHNSSNDTVLQSVLRPTPLDSRLEGNVGITEDKRIALVITFVVCVLGIPGNVLVIAVYIRKMTTSIRVYMFALAVADLVVCIYGIVTSTVTFAYIGFEVATYCAFLTLTFSVFLLAFVSVERMLAVRCPNTFNMSLLRAKRALVAITIASVVSAVVLTTARVLQNSILLNGIQGFNIVSSVAVMTVCYSVMIVTLVKRERAAHVTVGVESNPPLPGPSTRSVDRVDVATVSGTVDKTERNNNGKPGTTAIRPNTLTNIYLLFIITLVFLVCWIPRWLSNVGFVIPIYVRRTFYLNSVVNPFIYSVMSRMFRTDVQQVYRRIRNRLSAYHL